MFTSASIDESIGRRIRLLRGMRQLSQKKVAAALGVTFQQIQKYERGTNRVGADRLYQLSQVFKVPVGFFFDDFTKPTESNVVGLSEEQEQFVAEQRSKAPYGMGELELLLRHETLELARLYYRIIDPNVRKNVIKFLQNVPHRRAPKQK